MRKSMRYAMVSLILSNACLAEIIQLDVHDEIIEQAMGYFWGNARLKDGSIVQPTSEEERTTLPINRSNAQAVIKAGELSSIADWCNLNWMGNYLELTRSARDNGLKEKQVAFVGILHGIAMGAVDLELKGEECSPETRKLIGIQLDEATKNSLNWDATKIRAR